MLYLRPGQSGFDVHHQPHYPRHGGGHVDLRAAQQRHFLEAERPRRQGGELCPQVRRGREDHADHLVSIQAVSFHHLGHQLGRAVQYLLTVVCPDLDGASDGPDRHNRSFPARLSRDPIRPPGRPRFRGWAYMPTAAYRFPTSAVDSRLDVPGRSDPRLTGPIWVRTNLLTGWPTAASMRLTTCLRPSCSVTSTNTRSPACSTTRNLSALTVPSSSSTPVVSRRARSLRTGPRTSAR